MIDLDKARAARAEAQETHPELTFGGTTFQLPLELPLDTMNAITALNKASESKDGEGIANAFRDIAVTLVGASRADEFMGLQPSIQDMSALVEGIVQEYGFNSPGESSASTAS